MVSGYLLIDPNDNKHYSKFIQKRISKIIFPFIFWNIFYYLFNHRFGNGSISDFFSSLLGSRIHSHLYFLNIIIALYLITPFLVKNISKINLNYVVPLMFVLSSFYHFSYSFLSFPTLNNMFLCFIPYLGYYLAGYWVGHLTSIKHFKFKAILIFVLFFLSIFITRKLVFIFPTHEQDTILVSNLSLVVAAVASVIFYIFSHIPNFSLKNISNFLSKFSSLSLGLYLIHPFWVEILKTIPRTNYWLTFFFTYFSVLILSLFSVSLIKKIPLLNKVV